MTQELLNGGVGWQLNWILEYSQENEKKEWIKEGWWAGWELAPSGES